MLTTHRLALRPLAVGNAPELLELLRANRAFLKPWSPRMEESYYTLEAIEQDIEGKRQQWQDDCGYGFGVFERAEARLIGRINISQVVRGSFQNCFLGYWLDEAHNGCGLMSEAVAAMVAYAFDQLGLHRIEATTLLHNYGSQRVLEKAGFQRIGLARNYLRIDDRWQDHHIFALTVEQRPAS
jgi:ribosomal-protein-alanine N-acetyltransferase